MVTPGGCKHVLQDLLDRLFVLRLDDKHVVALRDSFVLQGQAGCARERMACQQPFELISVERILAPCLVLVVDNR